MKNLITEMFVKQIMLIKRVVDRLISDGVVEMNRARLCSGVNGLYKIY